MRCCLTSPKQTLHKRALSAALVDDLLSFSEKGNRGRSQSEGSFVSQEDKSLNWVYVFALMVGVRWVPAQHLVFRGVVRSVNLQLLIAIYG